MAAGESQISSCLKRSCFVRSSLVFFLYDFKAAVKMPSILEDEDVVVGVWDIVKGVPVGG